MRYSALISPAEAKLLLELEQQPLDIVVTDEWGVYLGSGERVLRFLPEEVATPDALHAYADVVRVRVEEWSDNLCDTRYRELGRGLGCIQRLSVMTTALYFSPPERCPATQVLGVAIPEGIGYDAVYLHPDDPAGDLIRESPDVALSLVDAGILLETEKNQVVVAADGVGYWVFGIVGGTTHERLLPLE